MGPARCRLSLLLLAVVVVFVVVTSCCCCCCCCWCHCCRLSVLLFFALQTGNQHGKLSLLLPALLTISARIIIARGYCVACAAACSPVARTPSPIPSLTSASAPSLFPCPARLIFCLSSYLCQYLILFAILFAAFGLSYSHLQPNAAEI